MVRPKTGHHPVFSQQAANSMHVPSDYVYASADEPVVVPEFADLDNRNQLRHCYTRHDFRYGAAAAKAIRSGELDLTIMHKQSHASGTEFDHEHGSTH